MPLFKALILIRADFPGINNIRYNTIVKAFLRILNIFYSIVIQLNNISFFINSVKEIIIIK